VHMRGGARWLSRQKYINLYYTFYVRFGDCSRAIRLMLEALSTPQLVKYTVIYKDDPRHWYRGNVSCGDDD
jgi:hypothetical protein